MLHRVNGARALLVLCIFNILGQCHLQSIPSPLLSKIPTEYDGCEDLQNFITMLKSMSARQAFTILSLPLASAGSPPKIQGIRQELLNAVTGGSLSINNILQDLGNVKNHNRYDLLITTLMAINEYTNINCALKDDISKAIFYLLKQKYLYKIDASAEDRFGTCFTQCSTSNHPYRGNGNNNFGPTRGNLSPTQALTHPPNNNRQVNPLRPAIAQEVLSIKSPVLKYSNTPNDNFLHPGQRYQPNGGLNLVHGNQINPSNNQFSPQMPSSNQQNPNTIGNGAIVHLTNVSPEILKQSTIMGEAPVTLVMQTSNSKQYPVDSSASAHQIQLLNPVKQNTGPFSTWPGSQNSNVYGTGSSTLVTLPAAFSDSRFTQGQKSDGLKLISSPMDLQHQINLNIPNPTLNPIMRPFWNPLLTYGFRPTQNSHPFFPYSLAQTQFQVNPFSISSMNQNGFSRNGLYPGLVSTTTSNKNGFGHNGLYPGLISPVLNKNAFGLYGSYPFSAYPAPMKPNIFSSIHGQSGDTRLVGGDIRNDQKNGSCACQKYLFEILLNRIIELEKRMSELSQDNIMIQSQLNLLRKPALPSLKTGGTPNSVNTTPGLRLGFSPPTPIVVVKKPKFDVDELLKVLPQPKYPKEQDMYNKFKNLLHSSQVQRLVNSLDLSKYHDNSELLDMILTTISKDVTITTETQEIISFFIPFREAKQSNFNFGNLINVVPNPLNSKEVLYYKTFKNYLTSKDVYSDINVEALKAAADIGYKLLNVLQQLNNSSKISPNLREIVNYYIPIISGRLNKIQFGDLVSLLTLPKTPQDLVKYNIMKGFLQSNEIYVVMKDINVSTASSRMEVLKMVLRQLISNPLAKDLQLVATYYRNILTFLKFGFNCFDILHLISPITDNIPHLRTIETYMYTNEFENILTQLKNVASLSDFDKLSAILSAVEKNASDKTQVVSSATYLLLKLNQARFFQSMEKIPPLLSKPKNPDEHQKLMTISKFLHTENAYQLLHNLDTTLFPDNKFLVEYILRAITDANVSAEVKEAAKYYLSLSEKLETLELVTKKEIKKNFQLHEIFSDALDLQKLTIPQKNALRSFFKYLTVVRPQAMSNFDSWDEAKTRWQFVKLMFKYFLEKAPTPVEIQASIKILDPLVKQDGRAALPP